MKKLIAIVGPTGAGKSDLALSLARGAVQRCEIVNCDALQVYRGLDIGTGKPLPSDRTSIRHHLFDVCHPKDDFSAADFVVHAMNAISVIVASKRIPIVVGGTGLYLRSLTKGLFQGPGRSPATRERLSNFEDSHGKGSLYRLLTKLDLESSIRIHKNDRVRIVRALEVRLESGMPMSTLMLKRESPLLEYDVKIIGLEPKREKLAERIERRVSLMIERGFVEEVQGLCLKYGTELPAFKAIGYKEILRHLAGELKLDEVRDLIVRSTLRYAKRQMTWFRKEQGVEWYSGFGDDRRILESVGHHVKTEFPYDYTETLHAETAP